MYKCLYLNVKDEDKVIKNKFMYNVIKNKLTNQNLGNQKNYRTKKPKIMYSTLNLK